MSLWLSGIISVSKVRGGEFETHFLQKYLQILQNSYAGKTRMVRESVSTIQSWRNDLPFHYVGRQSYVFYFAIQVRGGGG